MANALSTSVCTRKVTLASTGPYSGPIHNPRYILSRPLLFDERLTLKIPDGPDSGPADPIRVQVSCPDFEKVWKLPEASRTSPRVFLRVVRIVRIPEQLSDLEKSTYFAR